MNVPSQLHSYGATTVTWVDAKGEDGQINSAGGHLADRFDRLGRHALLEALGAGCREVRLVDGELSIHAKRTGDRARVQVLWGETVAVDDACLLQSFDPANLSSALSDPTVDLVGAGTPRVWTRADGTEPDVVVRAADPAVLGSASFRDSHGVKWAYVAGAMAGGISSVDLVVAMQRAGLLAFFGSGGLPVPAIKEALADIALRVDGDNWGCNLLANMAEPAVEERTVDLLLEHGVRRVSASAYVRLTPALVRYRLTGIHLGADGAVVTPNHVFAKVSRVEVAEPFLRPAPRGMVDELVATGVLTADQAELASRVPMAHDITAEGDSGGHTDHRPLVVVLPELLALRDRIMMEEQYAQAPRVGAAGGLGTPASLWAAYASGADYVLTGSVNQCTVEAGTSEVVKAMLGQAASTDVASGPAPDMFEMGAKVQVLSRGTMYAQRAQRLYDTYRAHASMEDIPTKVRSKLEKQIFRRSLDDVWADTQTYWKQRDPDQLVRAAEQPRHKMALVFRWYLGFTSRWARTGDDDRARDYQIWCGPAMGAFNSWAVSGPLEDPTARTVAGIADALMWGAVVCRRKTLAAG